MEQQYKLLAKVLLDDINILQIDCDDVHKHPSYTLLRNLLTNECIANTFLSLGTLADTDNYVIVELMRELPENIALKVWNSLTIHHKMEILTFEGDKISDTWPTTDDLSKVLLLSDKETTSYAFEQSMDTDDIDIAILILNNANPIWIDTDEIRNEVLFANSDDQQKFARALNQYRISAAKTVVRPLPFARLPNSGAHSAITQAVCDSGLMRFLTTITARSDDI